MAQMKPSVGCYGSCALQDHARVRSSRHNEYEWRGIARRQRGTAHCDEVMEHPVNPWDRQTWLREAHPRKLIEGVSIGAGSK